MDIRERLKEELHLVKNLRNLQIHFNASKCTGIWQCHDVCPIGCWTPDYERRVAVFDHGELCIACGACVLQCPERAIELV